jgi:hypothetical protein
VACIGTPLVKYRVHPASTSAAFGDYRSLPYLEEHFLAASIVLEQRTDRIADRARLRRRVAESFGQQTLTWAREIAATGNAAAARSFLRGALRMNPPVARSRGFWEIALMCAAGPGGLQWYRNLKRRFMRRSL